MNENLNLVEILKDCPKGTKLYSTSFGDVRFEEITNSTFYPIAVKQADDYITTFTADGKMNYHYNGECVLFPSKEQRDWSKFKSKKHKFDPNTLQPFDKVLVRDDYKDRWICRFFSHIEDGIHAYKYATIGSAFKYCIPYNDDTKHLLCTTEDAPEFYRYWED